MLYEVITHIHLHGFHSRAGLNIYAAGIKGHALAHQSNGRFRSSVARPAGEPVGDEGVGLPLETDSGLRHVAGQDDGIVRQCKQLVSYNFV